MRLLATLFFAAACIVTLFSGSFIASSNPAPRDAITVPGNENRSVSIARTELGEDRAGPVAVSTLRFLDYSASENTLFARIEIEFNEALLLELARAHEGGQFLDRALAYDPVVVKDENGGLALFDVNSRAGFKIAIREDSGIRPVDGIEFFIPIADFFVETRPPLSWRSPTFPIRVFGNPRLFPEDRYDIELAIDLQLQDATHYRAGWWSHFAPLELRVLRDPQLAWIDIKAGQPSWLTREVGGVQHSIEIEVARPNTLRAQIWVMLIGLVLMSVASAWFMLKRSTEQDALSQDLSILIAIAIAILPLRTLLPTPNSDILTRVDSVLLLVFGLLVATALWRLGQRSNQKPISMDSKLAEADLNDLPPKASSTIKGAQQIQESGLSEP